MHDSQPRLTAIYRYPVKSARSEAIAEVDVTRRGPVGDREFMVVDAEGRFLTQREVARLALVVPERRPGELRLTAPGVEPIAVPVTAAGSPREVVVWRDRVLAVDQGDVVAAWLTGYLGVTARLVRLADDFVRQVDQTYAPSVEDEVGLADGFPFLLIAEASLAELNGRLAAPLPMNRFRPNLVVAGCPAFAEDGWRRIRVGEVELAVVKPCARCVITTTDQATAERGREPLRTLATFRQLGDRGVMFGQNVTHLSLGRLRVGDPVEVLT